MAPTASRMPISRVRSQQRLGLQHLRPELGGVEAGERLTGLDGVVESTCTVLTIPDSSLPTST
ncbi:MAG TPA: hypothetical protein VJM14_16385 [Burkholderiales bacterium]|nr:hypothetical protein [Burkholderiales bacterium]